MRKLGWAITLGVAALALFVPALADEDHRDFHARNVFFADGDHERIDLADLYDGEVRTFDAGEKQIIAERIGDLVQITIDDPEDVRTIDCDLAEGDDCTLLIGDDGPATVMIMKSRSGEGMHSVDHRKMIIGSPDHNVFFTDDDGEAIHVMLDRVDVDEPGWVSSGGEENVFFGGGTMLRCPEGDTTMRLEEDEADTGPFYCPKHNIELEKAKGRVMVKEIRVHADHEE